jgi:hypothetical protein
MCQAGCINITKANWLGRPECGDNFCIDIGSKASLDVQATFKP